MATGRDVELMLVAGDASECVCVGCYRDWQVYWKMLV